ncbi:hypothetical protein C3747_33g81 [Trypanosoma cruzi]|uniref:Uncharacterized protein n=2 Tax=Trypanosoma cruzi TaxID=5693 RepID=Q4CWH7_TRYCC|nr:hypothetical protein, conserved [Trypanosoma cruzi]EAN84629.1 hypothetical protein, conserved [Trypanosoma cruzi]KAF8291113.1 hypothetical protein TcYC6_0122420 [Trypanosoma cruzi]PWV14890.1 hypothetical protein C3747_33g81 [Trypanosoma cruzi]RNC50497.1 hypothetical protein TcCL_ESM12453 [Trypanosoma cruzi]|eukprot:XP_806480.1 hypothetical protein [Trypanosoma cruzi strain CL Brener]
MLRRVCAFRRGNAMPVLCAGRWVSKKQNSMRVAPTTAAARHAKKTSSPQAFTAPLVLRGQVRPVQLASGEGKKRPQPKKGVDSRRRMTEAIAMKKRNALKRRALKGPQRQPAASRKFASTATSLRSEATSPVAQKGVRKGRPHAHTVQKKKYNKRVAAIAKLWRMQKKKTQKTTPASHSRK